MNCLAQAQKQESLRVKSAESQAFSPPFFMVVIVSARRRHEAILRSEWKPNKPAAKTEKRTQPGTDRYLLRCKYGSLLSIALRVVASGSYSLCRSASQRIPLTASPDSTPRGGSARRGPAREEGGQPEQGFSQ